MATIVMLKHPKTGIVRKGFFGFSWTTFFFGGFPALFRGDIVTGLVVLLISTLTFGLAGVLWAFFYNKQFTLKLIENGYEFADAASTEALARTSLGIAAPAAAVEAAAS